VEGGSWKTEDRNLKPNPQPLTLNPPMPDLDVIAVGAHPDDVEIACGGTLASLVQQGYQVGVIDLTDGEPTPHSPGPHIRLQEAAKAAEILGVQMRETLAFPNRRLFDSFETRVRRITGKRCRSPTRRCFMQN
jgi:LmbE family N-acetylglucosaminyl deacetylase